MEYFVVFVVGVIATGLLVLFTDVKKLGYGKWLLSFSGAYLFGLIFLHLLPEIFHHHDHEHLHIGLFILVGFVLQLALDFFSKGIEHGHAHVHGPKFPLSIFIGLCLHSFFEGMPMVQFNETGTSVNLALILGVLIHKIPITVVLASLIKPLMSKTKALIFIVIFALTLPLGSLVNYIIGNQLQDVIAFEKIIMALVVGIILHVATTILYESDEGHKFNLKKVMSILLGFAVALLTLSHHS